MWRNTVTALYPDILHRTYCVPPVHFNRVRYERDTVPGTDLPALVLPVPFTPPVHNVLPASQPSGSAAPVHNVPPASQPSGSAAPVDNVPPASLSLAPPPCLPPPLSLSASSLLPFSLPLTAGLRAKACLVSIIIILYNMVYINMLICESAPESDTYNATI